MDRDSMKRAFLHDRISDLPDALRLHILGCLPRKYAIRTGVLSTKWKDLWKHRFGYSTIVRFDESFTEGRTQKEVITTMQVEMNEFKDKRIEVFILDFYPGKGNEESVNELISQAVSRGINECRLDFSKGLPRLNPVTLTGTRAKIELKEKLFKGNLLSVLHLNSCRLQRNFAFRYFHDLELVFLTGLNMNDPMLENLIKNCKVLRSLNISECMNLGHINLSGPHLRLEKLSLVNCWNIGTIVLAAPRLASFNFFNRRRSEFLFYDTQSLKNVSLFWDDNSLPRHPDNCAEMFEGNLNQVEVMIISSMALQRVPGSQNNPWTSLSSLKELQLIMIDMTDWDLMAVFRFLRSCYIPRIERLFIELPVAIQDTHVCPAFGIYPMHIALGYCPMDTDFSHLKVLKMRNFVGQLTHFLLLALILSRASTLEVLVLVVPHQHENSDLSFLLRVVSRIKKASPHARLWLIQDDQCNIRPTSFG